MGDAHDMFNPAEISQAHPKDDLVLRALRASCADVCSFAAPNAHGTGCHGECHRDLADFNQDEIRNMQAVVQSLTAQRGWRLVRLDHLMTIMCLLPPPPLTQDGLTHRFEGPKPHDTIYAIRKAFAEMLGTRPEQPFRPMVAEEGTK